MILTTKKTGTRLILLLASFLVACTISYQSIKTAIAAHEIQKNTLSGYKKATALEPDNPQNWYLFARYLQLNIENSDPQAAIATYKRALSLDPRNSDYWAGLASVYESLGSFEDARKAFVEAIRGYPESADIHWQYGNFLLRRGELPAAFGQFRFTLQRDPKRALEVISRCWRAEPDIYIMLQQVLPASTPIYLDSVNFLLNEKETDAALVVWERIVLLQARLRLQDVNLLLEVLLQKGRASEAIQVWDQALKLSESNRPPSVPGSLVWDGGFETDISDVGFAWRFRDYRGAFHGFDKRIKHSGNRSLRITFVGTENVSFAGACQFVPIEPGITYDFEGWLRTENIATTDRGINFFLSANGDPRTEASPELFGTHDWTRFVLPWKAAAGSHVLQICVARQASSLSFERISGTVWADDVLLTPAP